MNKILFCALTVLMAVTLGSGMALADKYKAGTYTGSATGFSKKGHPGKIEVEVTVDANSIKDIKMVTFEQTTKGKTGEFTAKAKDEIPAAIIAKQSLNVDSVAKASMSSVGIELAVAEALHKATATYKDGTYKGEAPGYSKKSHVGHIAVDVIIAAGQITDIKITDYHQTTKGKTGELTAKAKDEIPAAIVARQSVNVDSVAKASMSSDGIKIAVARALEQAR